MVSFNKRDTHHHDDPKRILVSKKHCCFLFFSIMVLSHPWLSDNDDDGRLLSNLYQETWPKARSIQSTCHRLRVMVTQQVGTKRNKTTRTKQFPMNVDAAMKGMWYSRYSICSMTNHFWGTGKKRLYFGVSNKYEGCANGGCMRHDWTAEPLASPQIRRTGPDQSIRWTRCEYTQENWVSTLLSCWQTTRINELWEDRAAPLGVKQCAKGLTMPFMDANIKRQADSESQLDKWRTNEWE